MVINVIISLLILYLWQVLKPFNKFDLHTCLLSAKEYVRVGVAQDLNLIFQNAKNRQVLFQISDLPLHCEIKSLNKGYLCLHMLLRPDIQNIYCDIFQKCIPLITDLNSMRLECYN